MTCKNCEEICRGGSFKEIVGLVEAGILKVRSFIGGKGRGLITGLSSNMMSCRKFATRRKGNIFELATVLVFDGNKLRQLNNLVDVQYSDEFLTANQDILMALQTLEPDEYTTLHDMITSAKVYADEEEIVSREDVKIKDCIKRINIYIGKYTVQKYIEYVMREGVYKSNNQDLIDDYDNWSNKVWLGLTSVQIGEMAKIIYDEIKDSIDIPIRVYICDDDYNLVYEEMAKCEETKIGDKYASRT